METNSSNKGFKESARILDVQITLKTDDERLIYVHPQLAASECEPAVWSTA